MEETAQRREKWYHIITVEPAMTLYMLAFMLTTVIEQAFFVRRACMVNHNYTAEICDNLKDYPDIKNEVQITVSKFHMWNNICAQIFPIILAMFLGSWSDKRGRKFPLLMGLTGKLIYSSMFVCNALQPSWPLEYITYTATLPCALTGADLAIFSSCFAYISDVSTLQSRTVRVTILEVCYLTSMPVGIALGSYLFNQVLNKSYHLMFTINASLLCLAILYSFLNLKWRTTDKQKPLEELQCCTIFADFFDWKHVEASLKVLLKKREMHRRLFLIIFLIAMALYTFQRDEKQFLFLYTQYKFDWDTVMFSHFKTFQSAAYSIMTLLAIPIMSKLLKWKDTVIIFIAASAHAGARLIYIFAEESWLFFLGSGVSSIGPVAGPVIRSMISKIVPISERGKVFALLSVCDNAVPFISSTLYSQIYQITLARNGGIFWLTFGTQVGVFLLIMIVHIILGDRSLAVPETEKAETLIVAKAEVEKGCNN